MDTYVDLSLYLVPSVCPGVFSGVVNHHYHYQSGKDIDGYSPGYHYNSFLWSVSVCGVHVVRAS